MYNVPCRKIWKTVLMCCFLGALSPGADGAERQFIVVNLAPGEMTDESVFQGLQETFPSSGAGHLSLGAAGIFSYLHAPRERTTSQLTRFLDLAARFDIPIVVQLDGEQWWGGRPDLWNWWDPSRPGFSPENRKNVEWSGWGPEHAIKIAWRNWGRQIRVLPPPNLMSPAYREACHDEMRILVPLILEWWKGLPDDKKHLLIGIKLGWESSIGLNAFYYPNGNALLDRPQSEDPQTGLEPERIPDRGVTATGYAAVTTARLAESGRLEEAHLAEIVRRHLEDLCGRSAELGVPRARLFTHTAGWKAEELLYDSALNKYSCPGWSFYKYASDPAKDRGVRRALRDSDAPFWAAVEWLLMGNQTRQAWRAAIENTLSDPKCRYLCIYNWGGIKNNQPAIDAIEGLLDAPEPRTESEK